MRKWGGLERAVKRGLKDTEEESNTKKTISKLRAVRTRGYLKKDELLIIGKWKLPTERTRYLLQKNTETRIRTITRKAFKSKDEEERMELLTRLRGVAVPTASAILMLTDPRRYGVIDIRIWRVLYRHGYVDKKPHGTNLKSAEWLACLEVLRMLARKFKKPVRDIERVIFDYHKEIQRGRLYTHR